VTATAPRTFDAQDVVIACAVALLAQLVFVAAFSMPSPALVEADISDQNSRPIAVSITPVMKLGSKTPGKLPSQWMRRPQAAAKSEKPPPSTQAEKTPEAIPKPARPDASFAPVVADAGRSEPTNPTAPEAASAVTTAPTSSEGSEQGSAAGTETDPLKGRAADMYRAQLASWFASHFQIRGKVPFDKLKTLHATAVVTVTGDRKVGSFSVVKPSGDPTFDAEVRATLTRIQSGAELPAPPPMYPDMLGQTVSVGFQCTVQKLCE
jgi:outer membrane biosynthesis protein TonB